MLASVSLSYWTVDILSKYFPSSCGRACISFFLAELNFSKTSILSAPESIFHQTISSVRVKLSYSVRRFYIPPDIYSYSRKLRFAHAYDSDISCESLSSTRARERTYKNILLVILISAGSYSVLANYIQLISFAATPRIDRTEASRGQLLFYWKPFLFLFLYVR